jgi:hypothetical protein
VWRGAQAYSQPYCQGVNRVSGESRHARPGALGAQSESARRLRICPRCRREFLPARLRSSSLARNALRQAAKGMVVETDAAIEKAKRRKLRQDRKAWVEEGALGRIKTLLVARTAEVPVTDECEECLALQGAA